VVLLLAIAGIAWYAFSLGAAQNVQLPAGEAGAGMPGYAFRPYFWPAFPFYGFGCFALLIPLFLLCLAFGAFRRLFWGPRWSHMHHGPWHRDWEEGFPPMFREWHRRAHIEPDDEKKS
jgi:hypothetical protein